MRKNIANRTVLRITPTDIAIADVGAVRWLALGHWLNILRRLSRTELSVMVALSGLAGVLFAGGGWHTALPVTAGIWLLTAGCSALNQWQEQDLDARMQRTRLRPLPAGELSEAGVLTLSLIWLTGGILLLSACGSKPLLLGLLAVTWYNGIYTPLKRRTPFAALPGAVCGALPPLIGWSAAGASLLEPQVLILSGTLFLWQIPHTWLLLCRYRLDLQNSGLPDLFKRIPTERLLRITHCWLLALLLCYLLFPLFSLFTNQLLINSYLALLSALAIAAVRDRQQSSRLFHLVNLSMALLLLSLIIDSLLK